MGEAKARKDAAEREASRRVDEAIHLVYLTALYGGKMAGLEAQELPRVCVAGAVRLVEKLLEQYHGIMEADMVTRQQIDLLPDGQAAEERARYDAMLLARRHQIVQGLEDLHVALAEGQQNVARLGESLVPRKLVVQ